MYLACVTIYISKETSPAQENATYKLGISLSVISSGYKYASDSDMHKEGNLEDSIVPMTRFLLLSPETNTEKQPS